MSDQLPAQERKGTVTDMLALDLAAERAWADQDFRLMAVATAAWTMLGWGSWYLAEDISCTDRETARRFQDHAIYAKNRRLLRAEARGFARCLRLLEMSGALDDRELSNAKLAFWLAQRDEAAGAASTTPASPDPSPSEERNPSDAWQPT